MIYIDPPYNTKKKFIYNDNFKKLKKDSLSEGDRLHSNWLNMMYPRLKLARNLLADDGVIFIQIDDKEYENLLKIVKEIFGEENFINTICVNMSNLSGPKINNAILGKKFPKIKEYLLLFCKNKEKYKLIIPKQKKEKWDPEYNLIIPELTKEEKSNLHSFSVEDLNLQFSKYTLESLNEFMKKNKIDTTDDEWKFKNSYRICASKPNTSLLSKANNLEFKSQLYFLKNETGDIKLIKTDFNKNTKTARIELLFAEDKLEIFFGDQWGDIVTTGGIAKEGDIPYPNAKKPLKLLKRILNSVFNNKSGVILDFFSVSSTTAHAVMQLNAEDGGNRKYIMVQLPEDLKTSIKNTTDKKTVALLNDAINFLESINKTTNICEIGKERIRRAGEKIKADETLPAENREKLDIDFKVITL